MRLRDISRGETVLSEIKITSQPSEEPVTTTEFLQYLHQNSGVEDTVAALVLVSSRRKLEKYLNLSFVTQTVVATYTSCGKEVELPRGPHTSITGVNRIYNGEATPLVEGTDYHKIGNDYYNVYLTTVMSSTMGLMNYAYEFTYTAGFGAATDVPDEYKNLILQQASIEYERGSETGSLHSDVMSAASLLQRNPTWF